MTHLRQWSVWRKVLTAVLCAAVLLSAGAAAVRWRAFVQEDNAVTCYDARYWTGIRYQMTVRSALEDGAAEEDLDYEAILRETVSTYFTYELTEDLTSPDLCREGGQCTFVIDEQTHSLSISCDKEGHAWYDDTNVTDEDLDKVTW